MVENKKHVTSHQLDKMFQEIKEFKKVDSRINTGTVCRFLLGISPSALKNAHNNLFNMKYKYYELWEKEVKPQIQKKQEKYKNKDIEEIYNECMYYLKKPENRERVAKALNVKAKTVRTMQYVPFSKLSNGRILAIYDVIKGYPPYFDIPKEKHPTDRSFIYSKISEVVENLIDKGFSKKDIGLGLFQDLTIIHQYTNLRKKVPRKKVLSLQKNYQKLDKLNSIANILASKTIDDLISDYGKEEIIASAKKHFGCNWNNIDKLIRNRSQKIAKKRIFETCCFMELERRIDKK